MEPTMNDVFQVKLNLDNKQLDYVIRHFLDFLIQEEENFRIMQRRDLLVESHEGEKLDFPWTAPIKRGEDVMRIRNPSNNFTISNPKAMEAFKESKDIYKKYLENKLADSSKLRGKRIKNVSFPAISIPEGAKGVTITGVRMEDKTKPKNRKLSESAKKRNSKRKRNSKGQYI